MSLDDELAEYAARRTGRTPTSAEARELVQRAADRHARRTRATLLLGGAGLAVAAGLAAVLLWLAVAPGGPRVADSGPAALEEAGPVSPATAERALATGVHAVGQDVLTVDGAARVLQDAGEVRVALEQGSVTVQAARREPGQTLVVEAGAHEVVVVGTRFEVVLQPFDVLVHEGIVEVRGPEGTTRLIAGDTFGGRADAQIDVPSAPVAPAVPALPDLDTLTTAVLEGRLDEARAGLARRLDVQPTDAAAWRLLARVEGRTGDVEAERTAWAQVVTHGGAGRAREARLELAGLADDPAEAVRWLQEALKEPGPLGPEIGLKLGRAHRQAGDLDGARDAFRAVIDTHPETAAAGAARAELGTLGE